MEIIWKTITEGNGDYQISKYGEIKSTRFKNSKIMKWQLRESGEYSLKIICEDGISRTQMKSILMLKYFPEHIGSLGYAGEEFERIKRKLLLMKSKMDKMVSDSNLLEEQKLGLINSIFLGKIDTNY